MKIPWFVLTTKSQSKKFNRLLDEILLVELTNKSSFMLLGYKNLTPQDKETYYFLQNMALMGKNRTNEVSVSLDFIADALGTTIRTQRNRINSLKETRLLRVKRKAYKHNTYVVIIQPLPDSTLVSTLIKLIRRKRLYNLLNDYKKSVDPYEKDVIKNKIENLHTNKLYSNIPLNLSEQE
jgi:hypothetical protein